MIVKNKNKLNKYAERKQQVDLWKLKYYNAHNEQIEKELSDYEITRSEIVRLRKTVYNTEYSQIHREEITQRAIDYNRLHPTCRFLGRHYQMKYHDRAPKGYVWHHTCYDHSDPEANMVLLLKSSHTQGHNLLRKLGIEIPHVNEENL